MLIFLFCLILIKGLLLTYMLYEARQLDVKRQELHLPHWPLGFNDIKILFISDFHTRRIPDHVRQELGKEKVDLVLIGGDMTTKHVPWERVRDNIRFLGALAPCYAVFGNHDYYSDYRFLDILLREEKVTPLDNTAVSFESGDDRLWLIGVDDFTTQRDQLRLALSDIQSDGYRLLLSHNPVIVNQISESDNIRGILAGHTHGMQINIPFLWNLLPILGIMFLVKEPKLEGEPPKFKKYVGNVKKIFKKEGRWLIATFFVGTIGLFILFGILFYLSDILETTYNINGLKKGYILAIPLLAMATTSYITGRLIKKNFVLMKTLIIVGLLLMAGALIPMMFFEKRLAILISLLVLNGIGTGLALPCINSFITGSVDKANRGMITSLYNGVRFGGVALGPPIFGWLMTMKPWILFGSNAALALLAVLWTSWAIRVKGKGEKGKQGEKTEQKAGWQRVSFSK